YVAQPGGVVVLNTPTLSELSVISGDPNPGPLALSSDGRKLFTIDQEQHTLWVIDTTKSAGPARLLNSANIGPQSWMTQSSDSQSVFVLRGGNAPSLQRFDAQNGQAEQTTELAGGPPPRDLLLLEDGRLAIARG